MKKLMTLMLGMTLVFGTASLFAQELLTSIVDFGASFARKGR